MTALPLHLLSPAADGFFHPTTEAQLQALADEMGKSDYGRYLSQVIIESRRG